MPLRDLREDLRQRLRAVDLEISQLQERLGFLHETKQHLEFSLKYEELRVRYESDNLAFPFLAATQEDSEASSPKFRAFLAEMLSNGNTWSLEDLKKRAIESGLDFDGKHPGRVLHFALIGMQQNGLTEKVEGGLWRLKAEAQNK